MRLYRWYIWDFDGTLFDSYPHTAAALCEAARRCGVPAAYDDMLRRLRGSVAAALDSLALPEAGLALFRRLHGDADFPPPIVPFPDARPALEGLSARGASHLLYSHSRRRMSTAYLARFGLDGLFAGDMTPDDPEFVRKPDPAALLALMRRHGVDAREAVMVGDRALDARCARAAGIDAVWIDRDGVWTERPDAPRIGSLTALLPDKT